MSRWPGLAAALASLLAPVPVVAAAPAVRPEYGVYCVQGRLVLEQKRIEELKHAFGGDVCRLDQDPSLDGARRKATRLGGAGAKCSCNPS